MWILGKRAKFRNRSFSGAILKGCVFCLLFFSLFFFIFGDSFPKMNSHFRLQKVELDIEFSSPFMNKMKVEHERKILLFELELRKTLDERLERFKHQYIWEVHLSQVRDQLEGNEWVSQAFIQRKFPSGLSIKILVSSPVLVHVNDDGSFSYVTERGDFVSHPFIWDVPILRGEEFLKRKDLVNKMIQFIRELPLDGVFSRSQISDISYNDKRGFVLYLVNSEVEVRLGTESFLNKHHYVEYVLEYLNARGVQARVIDARFSKKIVVSLKNQA